MNLFEAVEIDLKTRAIFIPHSGFARPILPVRRADNIDRFAEHLANGCGVTEAARMLGYSSTYGNAMLQRIRKRLGPQAI